MNNWLLGKKVSYKTSYNPDILTAIPRALTRADIGIELPLPFKGVDIWNAWEISWLNKRNMPQVATAQIQYSANSEYLIESKSLKLYLNSLNQTQYQSPDEVINLIRKDLSHVVGKKVDVTFFSESDNLPQQVKSSGICLDNQDIEITSFNLNSAYLTESVNRSTESVTETLFSHLFKSNCSVTGQPDWASVFITYTGKSIDPALLLKYLISFRNHQAFHEPCVEQIYVDIMKYCTPDELTVFCRYTRRGGLDINPYRSSSDISPINQIIWRQ